MFKIIAAYVVLSASGDPSPHETMVPQAFPNQAACWAVLDTLDAKALQALGSRAATLGARHVILRCEKEIRA